MSSFFFLIRSSLHFLCSLGTLASVIARHDDLSCSNINTKTHTHTCVRILHAYAPVHMCEIECTHILSLVGSDVPLPVS